MKEEIRKEELKTLLWYNLLFLIIAVIFYFALPVFLNYPANSINNSFEKMIDSGLNYYVQYIIATLLVVGLSNILFLVEVNKVKGWSNFVEDKKLTDEAQKKLIKIKKNCLNTPIKLYIIHAVLPALGTGVGLIATGAQIDLVFKISLCVLSIFITMGLVIYVLSKNFFGKILAKINNIELLDKKAKVNNYRSRIFFQFLPLVLLIATYTYLIVNSVAMKKDGELINKLYLKALEEAQFEETETLDETITKLNTIEKNKEEDTFFIVNEEEVIYQDTDADISQFFIKYIYYISKDNRTYGYYATDLAGTYLRVNLDGQDCAIGIMYETRLNESYWYIWGTLLFILCGIILFLEFFSRDFTEPILTIASYMRKMSSGESIDYNQKIPVTSNDELGELIESFNEILELEKRHVETIKENQETLVETGRLSSLGQLIGGIAHNLKTPIMSISGNIQGLQDLITEYHASIGDPEVTNEDHVAIANDMQELVDKSRVYLSYMSDIITTVKGQATQLDSSENQVFGVLEVLSRIEILMKHELKSALIEMVTTVQEDVKTVFIKGDINSLVQVMNNLIQNAIYAYEGRKNEIIELKVEKQNKNVCFILQDYGCGMPDNIKEKIFKEMVTTKGKNGTGLGLYMSYSTIVGKFKGEFKFESEVGKGTTFYITIPIEE